MEPCPSALRFVSGAGGGIVEASTENIEVGTPVSSIVTAINVKWGDHMNRRRALSGGISVLPQTAFFGVPHVASPVKPALHVIRRLTPDVNACTDFFR
jgi:hypothetical protein